MCNLGSIFILLLAWLPITAAPLPDVKEVAAEEYRRAEQAVIDFDRSYKEQRLKLVVDSQDKEFHLHIAEQITAKQREKDQKEIEFLTENIKGVAKPEPGFQEALDKLQQKQTDQATRLRDFRKEAAQAQESLRLADRLYELQRRHLLARLDAAEAKLRPDVPSPTELRVRELERKIDALNSEIGKLREELKKRQPQP